MCCIKTICTCAQTEPETVGNRHATLELIHVTYMYHGSRNKQRWSTSETDMFDRVLIRMFMILIWFFIFYFLFFFMRGLWYTNRSFGRGPLYLICLLAVASTDEMLCHAFQYVAARFFIQLKRKKLTALIMPHTEMRLYGDWWMACATGISGALKNSFNASSFGVKTCPLQICSKIKSYLFKSENSIVKCFTIIHVNQ